MVDLNDGFFVIWSDNRSGNSDIYGQKIDFNGNVLGDLDGLGIAVADGDQTKPSITYNETADEVMVCWDDRRNIDTVMEFIRNELAIEYPGVEFFIYDTSQGEKNKIIVSKLYD